MTELWIDLNGNGPQQGYMNVYRTGQNAGGNYSSFHGIGRYLAKGYGSWGTTMYWSESGPWGTRSGNFYIGSGSGPRYDDTTFDEWDFNVGHDGEGYMGGFNWSLGMSCDHSSIGSGNGGASEGAAPRIAKRPQPPNQPTVSAIKPRSAHISFQNPNDQRGSAVTNYQTQILNSSSQEVAFFNTSGGEIDSGDVLSPGQNYTVRTRAQNGASYDNGGFSDWTAATSFRTASGAYYDADDSVQAYNPVEVLVGKDGAFVSADILVGKGGSYVTAG